MTAAPDNMVLMRMSCPGQSTNLARGQLGRAQHRRVEADAAGAHTDQQPALGDVVQGGDLAGEVHRVPEVG